MLAAALGLLALSSDAQPTLYTVGYAHLDTQWRWTYEDTIREFLPKTMRMNFDLFEKYPGYTFNFSGSRRYRMMEEYYPEDFERVKRYAAAGRWRVAGSSVDECDTLVPSSESILRHVLYGNQYFRKTFGQESEDFLLPDCFGFSASLPSLLAHAGLKGFSSQKLTWNSARGIPAELGFWKGPDGAGVTVALNPGSYTAEAPANLASDPYWTGRVQANGQKFGVPYDFLYHGTGDTGGSPTEPSVARVQEALGAPGPVKVVSSSADQMFKDITPEQQAKLPSFDGELLLVEHSAGSLTSQAAMKRWNRMNEVLADHAERAATWAWALGEHYPEETFASAWDLILGSQMHDIMPGTTVPEGYRFSWNDELLAMNRLAGALTGGVESLAQNLDTDVDGRALVLFNPLSFARTDSVQANLSGLPRQVVVRDAQGQVVPSQRTPDGVAFTATLPPLSLSVFSVQAGSPQATELRVGPRSLENERYRVGVGREGDIDSIYDKQLRRELLRAPIRLALLEDSPREWPAWNIDFDDWQRPPRAYVGGPAKVEVAENGPARVALRVTRQAEGSTLEQVVSLAAGGDRVEIAHVIDWATMGTTLKLVVPPACRNDVAVYGHQSTTIARPSNHSRQYEVPHQTWFGQDDPAGQWGLTVIEDGRYGSDKPDDGTLRLTLIRTPVAVGYPDQATQDLGRHRLTVALAGHAGTWADGNAPSAGARLNQPIRAFAAEPHPGTLGRQVSLGKSSGARIQALKRGEDGETLIVRLHESLGKGGRATLELGLPVESAWEVDGQERKVGDAKIEGGVLATEIKPFGLRTFAFKLSRKPSSPAALALAVSPGELDPRLPARLAPRQVEVDGFVLPVAPAAAGAKVALPSGRGRTLLVALSGGEQAVFDFDGRRVEVASPDLEVLAGQWHDRLWKPIVADQPARPGGIYGLLGGSVTPVRVAWYATHIERDGRPQPYRYGHVWFQRIAVPDGVGQVSLPASPTRVLALGVSTRSPLRPASALMDRVEPGPSGVSISPEPGTYRDAVRLVVRPGLYVDQGQPVVRVGGKPVPSGVVWLSRTTNVELIGPGGVAQTLRYEVRDAQPPKLVGAVRVGRRAMLTFHEPVLPSGRTTLGVDRAGGALTVRDLAGNPVRAELDDLPEVRPALDLDLAPNVAFDGTRAVEVPFAGPGEALTLVARVRVQDRTGNRRIAQYGRTDEGFRLWLEDGKMSFEVAGVGKVVSPLPKANEFMVAAAYDGQTLSLQLGDLPVSELPAAGALRRNGQPLVIGAKHPGAPAYDHWVGDILRVQVFDRALAVEAFADERPLRRKTTSKT